jgi:mono/diheme cytochrome c family protein
MLDSAGSRAFGLSILFAISPLVLTTVSGCVVEGDTTLPPPSNAGAAAIGGTSGGVGGVGGAVAGAGGVSGGVGGAAGGIGGATAGTGGPSGGNAGTLGGAAGAGGSVGGSAGSGGAAGSSAGVGGSLGGAGAAGSAGAMTAGSAGFTPAIDRTTAWNDPDYGCGNCHGEEGEGIVDRGPEIRHPNRELFDFMVREGDAMPLAAYRDPMDPVTTAMISDTILNDIYTWLNGFPKPTTGAELFADYCSYCHGPEGRGGNVQGYAKESHSAPFEKQGAEFLAAVRSGHIVSGGGGSVDVSNRTEWMPPFPATVLTDAEIGLIEAWLPKN